MLPPTRPGLLVLASVASCAVACSSPESRRGPTAAVSEALGADGGGDGSWVGTWATAEQDCGGGTTFNQQTLRHIVHTSIGGSAARVRLSNAFGQQPITVSDVHIAQRTSDSSVDGGSDRAVTFGGQSSTTIAPGAVVVSDSVDFAVTALSDVAVSLYFPSQTTAQTCHQSGFQTSYIAGGDVSGNGDLSGAQTTGSYFILTSLDVQNTAAAGAVVTLGASITDGFQSASDDNKRWPNDLAVRMASAGVTVGVLNAGISGNQLLVDGSGQSALNRFARDVLGQSGVKWVVFADDPINDLGDSHPTTDQLTAGLDQLVMMAHQGGVKILCATLTPFEGAGYWSPTEETSREAYDAYAMTAASGCDGVIDMDGATHDPANPTKYLPAYDSGDHLHPNEAGLQAMADAVDLTLFAVPPPPDGGADDGGPAMPEGGSTSSGGSSGSSSGSSGGSASGSGSTSGSTSSGGSSGGSGSGSGSSSGSTGGSASSGAPAGGDAGDQGAPVDSSGGCGVGGNAPVAPWASAVALAALAMGARRRRAQL
jgi:lysophospholipase L1-like esterase